MPDTNENRLPARREPQPQGGEPRRAPQPQGGQPSRAQGGEPRRDSQTQGGGQRQTPRTRKRKRRRRPIVLTILIRIFQAIGTLLLVGIVTGCFLICFAVVYVRTSVIPKTYLNLSDYTMNENSIIYYQVRDPETGELTGELKELQTLSGKENRELIEYEDIPQDLINAFVAIEDKTFWEHQGVNWRRTAGGLFYMLTGRSIQGGSTIDQQLIKNLTGRDDVTVTRKILEIFTALELDGNYRKEDILTLYMNRIYLGNGCYGVQAAAQYYFGKNVWDLSLAECASLAGITNNPSLYAPSGTVDVVRYRCTNPECKLYSLTKDDVCEYCGAEHSYDSGTVWTNREFNKARQEIILREMAKEDISPQGAYITEAQRDAAIAQPLVFVRDLRKDPENTENPDQAAQDAKPASVYSWYTEAVITETINALQKETGMSEKTCRDRVFCGGLSIICAYDPTVQAAVDAIYQDQSNLDQVSSKTGQRLISAITVVDNSTGWVVAMGSTEEKTVNRGWNTPVRTVRQPGSSIKPLSVYSPAIEMGLITPATIIDDNPQLLNGDVWPVNAPRGYKGLTTVLDAVTRSVNTVALRVIDQVTPQASYDFMTQRYGFTSLEPYRVLSDGRVKSDIDRSPLSMGGLTDGVSTFEMAAAYATFPRGGKFTKATTVLEIRDSRGQVIMDNRPTTTYPIKPETAYYMNSMLTNVVSSGTGYLAKIPGQTVAGKTGTTNSEFDLWFCGYTSYYTGAVWVGYPKTNEKIQETTKVPYGPAMRMWQKVMAIVHEGKENAAFEVPDTLSSYSICLDCGMLSLPECALDSRGSRVQSFRLFPADAPSGYCECHVPVKVCMDSPILDANGEPLGTYHLAGEFCPEESVKTIYMVNYQRELADPSVRVGDADALMSYYEAIPEEKRYCYVHTNIPEPSPPPATTDEPWTWPWPSDNPGSWPPDTSYEPAPPPTYSPDIPTPPPQPSFDPAVSLGPDDSQLYVQVDEWGNPIP